VEEKKSSKSSKTKCKFPSPLLFAATVVATEEAPALEGPLLPWEGAGGDTHVKGASIGGMSAWYFSASIRGAT